MTGRLTAPLRRVLAEAEDVTGRLSGTEAQLETLARHGLAFRHARPPRAYFLTPAGHRLRQELLTAAPPPTARAAATPGGVFTARTGAESEPVADGPARLREVHSAWQGLVELRRMTNPDGSTDRPCAWERGHLVQAAALALEAGDCLPGVAGDGGYVVADTPQPDAVEIRSGGEEAELASYADVLAKAGWHVGEHRARGRGRVLLASPRRV
ncbi:hypothetical protein H9Y04_09790 [Streptomyces sp. TRM66268-LWL]|uniref:Uncharacterized protein n=1 Tax=Streptomyces polyasparticus TaxID=2767826 RepID=A0ABR7SBR9_9ACTN|nr:hypothetical protein [Streptomyces polyasparticus]MBC9712863.1 hypothetical protein [Streptomyces polyasparticus]